MQVYIGLDGGGTGSRAQVALSDGRRGSVFTAGSANVFSDPDVALTQITGLLARCVAEAHEIDAAARVDDPVVVLGLAGASESGAAARVIDALPYARITVLGDIDIALRGAFQDRDGIVVAVGTGSVLARQTAGRMQRAGGYGFLLGDEAGGAWIGREALRASLHAHDGFGQSGPTTAAIWAKFGSVAGMISFVGGARPADFAALAPMVLDRDRAGCPVAGAIMAAGAAYLLRAIRHLQAGSPDVPVAATGGLGPIWLERLRAGADLRVTDPMGTALDGALWQALHQDASRSATGTGTGTGRDDRGRAAVSHADAPEPPSPRPRNCLMQYANARSDILSKLKENPDDPNLHGPRSGRDPRRRCGLSARKPRRGGGDRRAVARA